METISSLGEKRSSTAYTFAEYSRYRSGCPSTNTACGHILAAVRSGMAECTPNFRASYDAADTTPRSLGRPPTTTAFPFNDGSNSSSTETKKASMSTWKMVRCAVMLTAILFQFLPPVWQLTTDN